ncbi:HXXEE domain-containing protein, partial [Francisella tularensis subsp. holarctica]|nr:HXXEE domain-containing protein [Francisella tularensis subsp. holarctica]
MMIDSLASNQNWAKVAPCAGIYFTVLLFANFSVYDPHFWGFFFFRLFLFELSEELYVAGGLYVFLFGSV